MFRTPLYPFFGQLFAELHKFYLYRKAIQMHKKTRPILLIFCLLFVQGCDSVSPHVNPDFPCPSEKIVAEGEDYPSFRRLSPDTEDEPPITLAEMEAICTRIKAHFAVSNMTRREAERIYTQLSSEEYLSQPGAFPFYNQMWFYIREPPPFIIEESTMLKRITESKYEVFVVIEVGCEFITYIHTEILVNDGVAQPWFRIIDDWRENTSPCSIK